MYCGELTRLRTLRREDIDSLLRYYNTVELRQYTGVPLPRSRSEMELWLVSASGTDPWNDGHLTLAVDERRTKELLGIARLEDIRRPHSRARFGLSIYSPAQRERGFGTDAARVMLWIAFNVLGLHSVYLDTMEDNERAIHVFSEVGFKRVGVMRETEFMLGQYKGLLYMDILREDFEDHNPGFGPRGS
jgi:diamine N-acetyltransferase